MVITISLLKLLETGRMNAAARLQPMSPTKTTKTSCSAPGFLVRVAGQYDVAGSVMRDYQRYCVAAGRIGN